MRCGEGLLAAVATILVLDVRHRGVCCFQLGRLTRAVAVRVYLCCFLDGRVACVCGWEANTLAQKWGCWLRKWQGAMSSNRSVFRERRGVQWRQVGGNWADAKERTSQWSSVDLSWWRLLRDCWPTGLFFNFFLNFAIHKSNCLFSYSRCSNLKIGTVYREKKNPNSIPIYLCIEIDKLGKALGYAEDLIPVHSYEEAGTNLQANILAVKTYSKRT